MRTYLDCIACFLRQALEAVRFVTPDKAVHERVMRETLRMVCDMDLKVTPPAMGSRIHRLIREMTGSEDPYRERKIASNRYALELCPKLKKLVENAEDPMEMAARFAVAGNVIDFGVSVNMDEEHYDRVIERAAATPFDKERFGAFRSAVEGAKDILYLADNAGEIAFDRLLIEELPRENVTVVVKGGPIINDATIEDARAVGLCDIVEVIDNGSDAPGTMLETCSEAFQKRFAEADVVIAKGQANYETLSGKDGRIFFLLKVKCPVIGRHIGREVGTFVLERS